MEDPNAPGNSRIDGYERGAGAAGAARDGGIQDALVWLGLLVNEPADDASARQALSGDAWPQADEIGELLLEFPPLARGANTERLLGGSWTHGPFRYLILRGGNVTAAYKSAGFWYANTNGGAGGGGGAAPTPTGTLVPTPAPTATPTPGPTPTLTPIADRITDGLIVLYEFDESVGATTVADTSGFGTPLALVIAEPFNVTTGGGKLVVNSGTIIESAATGAKGTNALKASEEITTEAWLEPATATGGSPSPRRIVTLSESQSKRNFTLGQQTGRYNVRLRTNDGSTNNNGTPSISTGASTLTTALTHVVFTYDEDTGSRGFYLNGVLNVSNTSVSGYFDNWKTSYEFALVNELNGNRDWLGEFYLVAVYDQALTLSEVLQNFNAGP